MLLPILLNLAAFILTGLAAWYYSGYLVTWFSELIGIETESKISVVVQFFLTLVIRVFVFILYLKFYRYFILIFFAPILTFISEKVQSIDTGTKRPFSWGIFLGDIWRSITVAVLNLTLELLIYLLLIGITIFLPILSIVTPVLMFVVASYFYGFAMLDYRNEFFMVSARESRKMIWQYKWLALGNGTVFNLLIFIPVLGPLLTPVLSVVAGGLAFNHSINTENHV